MKQTIEVPATAPTEGQAQPRQLTEVEKTLALYEGLCAILRDQLGHENIPTREEAEELIALVVEEVPAAVLNSRFQFAIQEICNRVGLRRKTR